MTRKTLLISCLYWSYTSRKTFESDFTQLFVLKVFNRSISRSILILHLLHFEFITTFSLFLAESVKICVPRGRPARVLFPDMFFFDQQGYCGGADFGVKEKVIWILRRDARVLCGRLKIICQNFSRIFSTFLYIFMLQRYERTLVGLGTFHSTCQN